MIADPHAENAEISRTAALLGGSATLNRTVSSALDAHDLLREGLPGHALEFLVDNVVLLNGGAETLETIVGISLRTYQRRKVGLDRPLSPEQSSRAWKFAEILGRVTDMLGSQAEAEDWLRRPAMALEGRRPIDLLSTPAGTRTIDDLLIRLEYGVHT